MDRSVKQLNKSGKFNNMSIYALAKHVGQTHPK